MDGLLPENVKVLIQWIYRVEYVRKKMQGDHNVLFKKCNHQEDQSAPFHTQVYGEIICPLHV